MYITGALVASMKYILVRSFIKSYTDPQKPIPKESQQLKLENSAIKQ